MTKCYLCKTEITERPEKGHDGYTDTHGNKVVPTPDYRCVGVVLSNGKDMVDYCTPVCRTCLAVVTRGEYWEDLKNNLLAEIKIHNFGPPHFMKKNQNFSVLSVKDLTEELRENGII